MATGITEQDVWKSADALLLEGQRPTIERVRQKIGRGSPNTVQPYLDTWFKGLGARIRDPQAFSAPPATPEPVAQAAEHFWQVALAEAREQMSVELEAERGELAADRATLETARQALVQEDATLRARADAATATLNLANAQLDEARQREAVCAASITALNARNEEASESLRQARVQLDETRAHVDRERQVLTERMDVQTQHWQQELDRERQQNKQAQQLSTDLKKRLETLQRSQAAQNSMLEQAQERVASLECAQTESVARLADADAALVAAQRPYRHARRRTGRSTSPRDSTQDSDKPATGPTACVIESASGEATHSNHRGFVLGAMAARAAD